MHDERLAAIAGDAIAELIHLPKLPACIDMQQRKRRWCRVERFAGELQHHATIFADRVEHHRSLGFGNRFADDVNALGFESLQPRGERALLTRQRSYGREIRRQGRSIQACNEVDRVWKAWYPFFRPVVRECAMHE